ncbi:MAG: phosphatidate cytidylyltransferase [Clostridia bacterium]|nr:phosphatidate cytidylyltransferase [Clostridia bacterium]
MLKRIITSVVGVIIMIPVLWYSDTYLFVGAMSILCVVGCFELMRCIKVNHKYGIAIPQYLLAAAMPFLVRLGSGSEVWFKAAIFAHVVFMLYLLAMAVFSHGKTRVEEVAMTFALCLYINVGFSSIILLRDHEGAGAYIFLLTFIGAWMTDIFAYFCGMAFGRHKLIPDVSPKKTVEGSIGGIVFCALGYVIYGLIIANVFEVEMNIIALGVFGVIISIVSQIGDLSASLIKREYEIKDYGSLFPGHGGVLDRFDSVLAVSSVLMVLVYSYNIV